MSYILKNLHNIHYMMSRKSNMKLTKVADEFADFDLLKPRDRPGPHFEIQETYSMFIITFHLKGYRRTDVKVERNKDGSMIRVSGESPIKDMLMVGGKVATSDIRMQRFQKLFKIPENVVLDKVSARFNEDDSNLMIQMPKASIGFTGSRIEELKTTEILSNSFELLQVHANRELSDQEKQPVEFTDFQDLTQNVGDEGFEEHEPRLEDSLELNGMEIGQFSHDKQEKENLNQEYIATNHSNNKEDDDSQKPKSSGRKFKICTQMIFGSALFMSLIVLIFKLVQTDKPMKQQNKIEDSHSKNKDK